MSGFRPHEHIRRRADFEQTYDTGTRASGKFMTVFVRVRRSETHEGLARLGIAATRKIGGAVIRNRAKRLVRELFRHGKPALDLDIVVVPRRELLDAPFDTLEREFTALLERVRLSPGGPARGPRSGRPRRAGGTTRV